MYKVVIDEDIVPEDDVWDIIDLAVKNKDHLQLVDSLFSKATVILILNYSDRCRLRSLDPSNNFSISVPGRRSWCPS